jgi:hypothetical protein
MSIGNYILSEQITNVQKLILFSLRELDGQELKIQDMAHLLGITPHRLTENLTTLSTNNIIKYNGMITFSTCNESFSVTLKDAPTNCTRKAHTSVTKARYKLEMMRLSGFVGTEIHIFNLSQEYDRLVLKHTGVSRLSLPPVPTKAKTTTNWTAFKKLYDMLVLNKFPLSKYMDVQFKALASNKKFGSVVPYPSMLYSTWAINNYVTHVKESLYTETVDTFVSTEESLTREVLQSSISIIHQIMESNPGLPELEAVLICQDSISPVFLALNKHFLKFLNQTEQEIPDDVGRVLVRFDKDKKYKTQVYETYKELCK